MRVLLTNRILAERTGTEINTRDIAVGLYRRGHDVLVFSPILGAFGEEIRKSGIPVVNTLRDTTFVPDVIHGHHFLPTLIALARFPSAAAVYFIHDWTSEHDKPLKHPRIWRYFYVRQLLRDRLGKENGIAADKIEFLGNAVDLSQFPEPRYPASKLRSATIFAYERAHRDLIAHACRARDIVFDPVGLGGPNPIAQPSRVLPKYDLAFATGRMALEALASGCAVIILDKFGLGGLVTPDRFEEFQTVNFAPGVLSGPVDINAILREIDRFKPDEAAQVTGRVHKECGLEQYIDRLLQSYELAIQNLSVSPVTADAEFRALSDLIEVTAGDATGADLRRLLRPYFLLSNPASPTLPANYTVDFGASGYAAPYQRGGWCATEPSGTWTDGYEAHLLFAPIDAEGRKLKLEISCSPFTTECHQSQRVEILLNGVSSARWTFTQGETSETRTLSLGHQVSFAPVVHVTLKLPDAVSPAALGLSRDSRNLGIFVEWMRLLPE
jgi:hypothetical protein